MCCMLSLTNSTGCFHAFNVFILYHSRQKVLLITTDLSDLDRDKMFRQIK